MRCPFRVRTITSKRPYKDLSIQRTLEYEVCYEDECPFWDKEENTCFRAKPQKDKK